MKKHGIWNSKPINVPMDTHLSVAENGYKATNTFRTQYQSTVGSLMYAILRTRPHIAYSVSVVSRDASTQIPVTGKRLKRFFVILRVQSTLNEHTEAIYNL